MIHTKRLFTIWKGACRKSWRNYTSVLHGMVIYLARLNLKPHNSVLPATTKVMRIFSRCSIETGYRKVGRAASVIAFILVNPLITAWEPIRQHSFSFPHNFITTTNAKELFLEGFLRVWENFGIFVENITMSVYEFYGYLT